MGSKKSGKKKPHLIPHDVVFPEFYGEDADKEWEEAEERSKLPVEKRKKPKKSFRWRR